MSMEYQNATTVVSIDVDTGWPGRELAIGGSGVRVPERGWLEYSREVARVHGGVGLAPGEGLSTLDTGGWSTLETGVEYLGGMVRYV